LERHSKYYQSQKGKEELTCQHSGMHHHMTSTCNESKNIIMKSREENENPVSILVNKKMTGVLLPRSISPSPPSEQENHTMVNQESEIAQSTVTDTG
jgi:hypothetical protein